MLSQSPREYLVQAPGDVLLVDTANIRLNGSALVYNHFALRDFVSHWDVLGVHGNATAYKAAGFLEPILKAQALPCVGHPG